VERRYKAVAGWKDMEGEGTSHLLSGQTLSTVFEVFQVSVKIGSYFGCWR
jgi:hypothetical protein